LHNIEFEGENKGKIRARKELHPKNQYSSTNHQIKYNESIYKSQTKAKKILNFEFWKLDLICILEFNICKFSLALIKRPSCFILIRLSEVVSLHFLRFFWNKY